MYRGLRRYGNGGHGGGGGQGRMGGGQGHGGGGQGRMGGGQGRMGGGQGEGGGGGGQGMMGGGQGMMGHGGRNSGAMRIIHNLLDNRQYIKRTVNLTDTGAQTYTRSDDPQVSDWIQTHVAHMIAMVKSDEGMIRGWDPLFRAVFEHSHSMKAVATNDDKGVHVSLTGRTPCGTSLAQMHAEVVSNFIKRGYAEVHESHSVPEECAGDDDDEEDDE